MEPPTVGATPEVSEIILPPTFMRGVPEGRGEFAAVEIRRNAAIEATLYRILPPGLRPRNDSDGRWSVLLI